MKPQWTLASLCFAQLILSPLSRAEVDTLDGDRVGNGGFAYVCRGQDGKITSARLLDLWEAEDLQTWSSNAPVEKQIAEAIKKMKSVSPNAGSFVAHSLARLQKSMVYVNRPLTRTEDAFPPYIPAKGCAYEQVARYEPVLTETGTRGLRIHREIYDSPHFTNSDRAALFVHEAVYHQDRAYNQATNSQRARTIIAHLFSKSEMPNAIRMTIGALMGLKDEEGERRILALKDPKRMGVKVQLEKVDGIESDSSAGKSDLYQCRLIDLSGKGGIKTGWVTVDQIVGDSTSSVESRQEPTLYSGHVTISSFDVKHEFEDGIGQASSVMLRCEKKDASGKITPVSFDSYVNVEENAQCLSVDEDGSIGVTAAEFCYFSSKFSYVAGGYDFVSHSIEVVRGN